MWKGVISFGMVSIPVRLYVATERTSTVSFRQLCPEHVSPIKYKRWCAAGDHEVNYSEILKGYEIGPDNYVIIEDKDLENLPLPTSRTIEINEFVPAGDINPGLYYDSAYYVEPEESGRKPYYLLRQALEETNRTAVAKIALRDREHLCALNPSDGMVLMNVLHWPDEIRTVEGLKGLDNPVPVSDKELQMAITLIESLADDFDPSRYSDEYKEALMQVVNAKIEGRQVVEVAEPDEAPKVMDLMEALRASVEAAKAKRGAAKDEEEEEEAPAQPARKPASRRKAS
jgi:DNA end-binding protein Ku